MKTTFKASRAVPVALVVGFTLAMLGKIIYDLFNGYAVIPNLLAKAGIFPSQFSLESIQFVALAALAFAVGKLLFNVTNNATVKVAFATTVPWLTLCLVGLVGSVIGENGEVLREFIPSSAVLLILPFFSIVAVPFGIWLAYRGTTR